MTQSENDEISKEFTRTRAYFIYLIIILMLVQIVDTYCTVVPGAFPSKIAEEFLSEYSKNEQNAIMALGTSIASIGAFLIFFSHYFADKIGRKKMLAITVVGMGLASLMIMVSTNFVQYVIFIFIIGFFQRSDIWLIYINEEAEKKKRALWMNIILLAGLVGAFIMVLLRSIFITDTGSNWRAMFLFPLILGIPLCIVILLTLKESSKYQLIKEKGLTEEKESTSFKKDVKAIFQTENRKPYTAMLIMIAIYGGGTALYMGLFEKYISDSGALSQSQITLIFLLTVFAVIIAYVSNGILADRIGRKPLLYIWSILLPISVITWIIGAQQPNPFFIVLVGYAITHICYWGLLGIFRLTTLEMFPTEKRGSGLGFLRMCASIGSTIGLLLSSIFILFIGLGSTFMIFAIALFALLPLNYLYIKETKDVDLTALK